MPPNELKVTWWCIEVLKERWESTSHIVHAWHFPVRFKTSFYDPLNKNTDRTNLLLGALLTPPQKILFLSRLELQTFNCEWLGVVVCNRSNVCWRFCLNHSDAQNHICGVIAHVINSYTPSWNEAWNQYLMQNFILFPLEPQWISSQMPTRLWKIFESCYLLRRRSWHKHAFPSWGKCTELKCVRETWFETWTSHTPCSNIT